MRSKQQQGLAVWVQGSVGNDEDANTTECKLFDFKLPQSNGNVSIPGRGALAQKTKPHQSSHTSSTELTGDVSPSCSDLPLLDNNCLERSDPVRGRGSGGGAEGGCHHENQNRPAVGSTPEPSGDRLPAGFPQSQHRQSPAKNNKSAGSGFSCWGVFRC